MNYCSLENRLRIVTLVQNLIESKIKNREDQKDVKQEVYFRLHQKWSTYHEEGKFFSWVATVTYNTTITFLREKKKNMCLSFDELENDSYSDNDGIDTRFLLREAFDKLLDILATKKLSNDKQIIIQDLLVYHMSKKAISEKEHVSVKKINNTIKETRGYLLDKSEEERLICKQCGVVFKDEIDDDIS